jgi:RimJ/RimL family protein N-acetyltransferase
VSFEFQPSLAGVYVKLRPLRGDDFDALYEVARDPLIWEQHPDSDRYRKEVFRKFFKGAIESGGAFLVLDSRTGDVIGSTRFCKYKEGESEIEIGYSFLARSHWGGFHNGEMKRLMLDHAFKQVKTVYFLIGTDNRRSRRAVEKIGGKLTRSLKDSLGREGVRYEIHREESPVGY